MKIAFAGTYQEGIYKAGLPAIVLSVEDIHREYDRLKKLGVVFRGEPKKTEVDEIFHNNSGAAVLKCREVASASELCHRFCERHEAFGFVLS